MRLSGSGAAVGIQELATGVVVCMCMFIAERRGESLAGPTSPLHPLAFDDSFQKNICQPSPTMANHQPVRPLNKDFLEIRLRLRGRLRGWHGCLLLLLLRKSLQKVPMGSGKGALLVRTSGEGCSPGEDESQELTSW